MSNSLGRRALLANAGLTAVGVGAIALTGMPASAARKTARAAAQTGGDIGVLQVALALEHEGIAAYTIAAGSGLLTPEVISVASVFLGHHQGHRDALAKLIREAGGQPVDSKTNDEYIAELDLGALKSQADVLALATRLEMGATSAYVGQAGALTSPILARLFAGLAADEASHWAVLNSAIGGTVPAPAFVFGR